MTPKALNCSKYLRERSNTSAPTCTTHVQGDVVTAEKNIDGDWAHRSHTFLHDCTPTRCGTGRETDRQAPPSGQ